MRSLLAVLGALLLMTTAAGGAAGAGAAKQSDHVQDIGCDAVPTPDGDAYFYASISDDVRHGRLPRRLGERGGGCRARLDARLRPSREHVLQPDQRRGDDPPPAVRGGADRRDARARRRPVVHGQRQGRQQPLPHDRDGDRLRPHRHPDAAGRVPGAVRGPVECAASDVQVKSFFSQPHAFVRSFSSTNGSCELTNAEGDTAERVPRHLREGELFLDSFVTDRVATRSALRVSGPSSAEASRWSSTSTTRRPGRTPAAWVPPTCHSPRPATTSASCCQVEQLDDRVTGSLVDVEGTLTMSLGSFDLGPCVIATLRSKEHTNATNGPKPAASDRRTTCRPARQTLKVGGKASVSTKGAQVPSEAAYPCMDIEDFDGTIVHDPGRAHRLVQGRRHRPVDHRRHRGQQTSTPWSRCTRAAPTRAPPSPASTTRRSSRSAGPSRRGHLPDAPPAPRTGSRSAASTRASSATTRTCPTATSGSGVR